MIPLVQLLLSVGGLLFAPSVLRSLGLMPPAGGGDTKGSVSVLTDHPAAATPAATPAAPTTPATPGTPSAPKEPGAKTIVNNVFSNGWVTWGAAALFLTLPLAVSQFRAGFADATDTGRELVNAGRSSYRRVDNADDYTGLGKHRKGRS